MNNSSIIDDGFMELAEYIGAIAVDKNIVDKDAEINKCIKSFGEYLKANVVPENDVIDYTKARRTGRRFRHVYNDAPRRSIAKSFSDIMKLADDDEQRANTIPDDDKVSGKLRSMVTAMITAVPSLSEQHAMHFLLHTPHGRRLAEHFNNISKHKDEPMPQVDIMKLIPIVEEGLLSRAPNAKEFAQLYESDISFRREWASLNEAKQLMALGKGMATLKPTSTSVGNTNVSDDSAEAVRLLAEMATKNGRSFESVFSDPANKVLAAKTYTRAHRSSVNTDYLEQ
jgi:hypothetical protein